MNQPTENHCICLIGNPTRDLIVRGRKRVHTVGGTVLYAGLFFARSGIPVSIVGRGDKEMLAWIEARGIGVDHFKLANRVVTFENHYERNGRRQFARHGSSIDLSEIPQSVFQARAILVGAVLMEVDPRIVSAPRRGVLLLDVQGFLRDLGSAGEVILRANQALEKAIGGCDILKADQREAEAITGSRHLRDSARRLHQMGPQIVIITLSARGCGIFDGQSWIRIRPPKLRAVDSTGAGDVFDAAFLAEYVRSSDAMEAGRYGSAAAGLSVAGFGTTAVPSADQVRKAVRKHYRSRRAVTVERLSV